METKAILVAGGKGSRFYPFTRYTQKTLLPLYNRPVIDYALEQYDAVEFHKITIISNEHIGQIAKHVGQSLDGEQIHYVLEEEPRGVAEALSLARPYNENCRLLVYFSDNITTVEFDTIIADFNGAKSTTGLCSSCPRRRESSSIWSRSSLMKMELFSMSLRSQKPPF